MRDFTLFDPCRVNTCTDRNESSDRCARPPHQSTRRRSYRLQAFAAAFVSMTAAITSSATFFGTGS